MKQEMPKSVALSICGPLSTPGKMPGHGYSLPAGQCRLGKFLRQFPYAVCTHCYARRGRYLFPAVRKAMEKRLASLTHPLWVAALTTLIHASQDRHFRWHDSGDIQGTRHLANIIAVCKNLPEVKFWLPTREYQTVEVYRRSGAEIPRNLCIRYSANQINGPPPLKYGMPVITVSSAQAKTPPGAYHCPAMRNGNKCGRCRACWDPEIRMIDFPLKLRSKGALKGGN